MDEISEELLENNNKKNAFVELILQGIKFVGLSGVGWILDFTTFIFLGLFSKNLVLNNYLSSLVGFTFVFFASTIKLFVSHSKIPLFWKYIIYGVYQLIIIFLVSLLLNVIDKSIQQNITIDFILKYSAIISKIIITPITIICNFFVMKGLIEKI